jgi:putative flippase GtrA
MPALISFRSKSPSTFCTYPVLDCWSHDEQYFEPSLIATAFIRFGVVGTIGFVVDAGILTLALAQSLDLYTSRLISFGCAVTVTWFLNRVFTFRSNSRDLVSQWARFALTNSLGGVLNYGTYALLVWQVTLIHSHPIIGVAFGSLTGMTVNFILSRRWVFNSITER